MMNLLHGAPLLILRQSGCLPTNYEEPRRSAPSLGKVRLYRDLSALISYLFSTQDPSSPNDPIGDPVTFKKSLDSRLKHSGMTKLCDIADTNVPLLSIIPSQMNSYLISEITPRSRAVKDGPDNPGSSYLASLFQAKTGLDGAGNVESFPLVFSRNLSL